MIIVYMLGTFATFGIGRMAVDRTRTALLRVPLIGTIYSANRQLIESFSGTSVTGFKRVVLVQFPRANAWSLGFLTGITDAVGGDRLIMTYVPTAPLPNSGFVVLMPPEDVLDTDLSVPEAMQLIFSGGIVSPRTIGTKKIDIGKLKGRSMVNPVSWTESRRSQARVLYRSGYDDDTGYGKHLRSFASSSRVASFLGPRHRSPIAQWLMGSLFLSESEGRQPK